MCSLCDGGATLILSLPFSSLPFLPPPFTQPMLSLRRGTRTHASATARAYIHERRATPDSLSLLPFSLLFSDLLTSAPPDSCCAVTRRAFFSFILFYFSFFCWCLCLCADFCCLIFSRLTLPILFCSFRCRFATSCIFAVLYQRPIFFFVWFLFLLSPRPLL
jgi:apolipoprotein N-acyltransferase